MTQVILIFINALLILCNVALSIGGWRLMLRARAHMAQTQLNLEEAERLLAVAAAMGNFPHLITHEKKQKQTRGTSVPDSINPWRRQPN